MSALHHEGFANQSLSESCDDGLKLHDCYLTASVKCVPPLHKPLASEFANCSSYFANEIFLLRDLKCILALGRAAFETYFRFLGLPKAKFVHGGKYPIPGWPTLFASYHPTPRNVNTSLLTEAMFREVLQNIKHELR